MTRPTSAVSEHEISIRHLQSHSLPALVQRQLEDMILTGALIPGSKLTEIPLADQLGVSRGPVREAFRGLVAKGLVRVEKNRGVYVRTITTEEADDIYEVRLALEDLIVRKLAASPTLLDDDGMDELLAKSAKFAEKGDFANSHRCNMEFHDRLATATGNQTLADSYRRLVNELSLFRHQAHAKIRDASSLKASVADHRAIVGAIRKGDGGKASKLIQGHIEASRKRLQKLLGEAAE